MTNSPDSLNTLAEITVPDVVSVKTPADARFVAVIRMTGAAVCSRLGYTLDEVEDLKLAVDEAASVAIECAAPHSMLSVDFELANAWLLVRIEVPAVRPADEGSYAWGVLSALSSNSQAEYVDERVRISFTS
ncbi:MAG TPA: hypothetical protein VMT88_08660, partial [Actinomycetes bacterium]|nr:hypothetical protein [Actinomycetes bacterium]